MATVRVATAQCAIGDNLEDNLETCLRMLDKAAEGQPDLVVLPEFCNHLSWYEDQAHCHAVSLDLEGEWLSRFAGRVREHGFHAVINVTLRASGQEATGTSILYSPEGKVLGTNDKQVLIGHENDFLNRAAQPGPIIDTALGRLGLYACMDGVINETPRCLALRGAQLLCNSLNSFASDEGSLHIPVRAAENRVFVAAANKVGPLIPEAIIAPVSQATGIPERFLHGAGESQVVAPDGTVLACASLDREEVVWADIETELADNKQAGDGTDLFASRRPALYGPIAENPEDQPIPPAVGKASVPVGILEVSGTDAVASACSVLAAHDAQALAWLALPELDAVSEDELERLVSACDSGQLVSFGTAGRAMMIGAEGVLMDQPSVHQNAADQFQTLELPIGRVAVVPGADSRYPETFRLLALAGVEIVAVPLMPSEAWELRTGLVERAAENRINLIAASSRPDKGQGFIASLQGDFTVLTPWKEREFDGLLSQPVLTRAMPGELVLADVHPQHCSNKVVSLGTDLLRGRPWYLAGPIAEPLT